MRGLMDAMAEEIVPAVGSVEELLGEAEALLAMSSPLSERVAGPGIPAVFADKDGTIVEDVPFNVDPRKIRFLPGAVDGLRSFSEAGFLPVIVTNQSGVAKGLFTERELQWYLEVLMETLAEQGVHIAHIEYCPHDAHPADVHGEPGCACRKPRPGMILRAASLIGADVSRSWMIGDTEEDVEAGTSAGCATALVCPAVEVPSRADLVRPSIADVAATVLPPLRGR